MLLAWIRTHSGIDLNTLPSDYKSTAECRGKSEYIIKNVPQTAQSHL